MFYRRIRGSDRQPVASARNRGRRAPCRPGLETLEDRSLPSTTALSATYADTVRATGTGAGVSGKNTFFYDLQGTVAGGLPGAFATKVLYNGALGHGTNAITGGNVSLTVSSSHGSPGTVQGQIAGGSIRWNTAGTSAAVSVTVTVTGGTGAYVGDTGTATFTGTLDGNTQALTGSLSVGLHHPGSAPPPSGSSSGPSKPPASPPPSTSASYTGTLLATGTGAGTAGRNTFFYDLQGTLTGRLPGSFQTRVLYTGTLGHGTNTVTGGSWSLNVLARGLAGKVQGQLAGGSIRWNSAGSSAAVTVTLTVTGGTGAYAGDTGTATFTGRLDGNTEALSGTVTLNLKHPGSPSHTPPPTRPPTTPPPSGSTAYHDRLLATGTGAGMAGKNSFFYDLQGTLAGGLPGFLTTRVFYVGPLGHGTNTITGGSWSVNGSGSHGSPGKVQGTIAGGTIRWNAAGTAATLTVTYKVTGGTGTYAGDTGSGTFTGTLDGNTQALSGNLNVTLTRPRR